MATLTIRNLDDELKSQLRVRAARHDRSMEEEVRLILREALSGRDDSVGEVGLATRIRTRLADTGGVELRIPERDDEPRQPEGLT